MLRGSAQNPDVFFQAREAANPFYDAVPEIVQATMDRFAGRIGRQYHLFDYVGAPDAERVMVLMGSGVGAVEEAVERLVSQRREGRGLLKVRLYRPFDGPAFVHALPADVRADRRARPDQGARRAGRAAVPGRAWHRRLGRMPTGRGDRAAPEVFGGRYGLSSKEFTPAMAAGVFAHLVEPKPKRHFTVGIYDDVTHLSLPWDPEFHDGAGRRHAGRVLSAWAATAPSAPARTR